MANSGDVTQILRSASEGDRASADQLLPIVYDELRRLAQSFLQRERADLTLQATELVHEAFLRLVDQTQVKWANRTHFFAIAAQAIRRLLVDHARRKGAEKRGGGVANLSLDEALTISAGEPNTDLVALDAAMNKFAIAHPEMARVVEVRFFGGLTNDETSEVLAISKRIAERHWAYARAWLYRELRADDTAA